MTDHPTTVPAIGVTGSVGRHAVAEPLKQGYAGHHDAGG